MTEDGMSQGLHGSNTPEPWAEGKGPGQRVLWMENPLKEFTLENTLPSCLWVETYVAKDKKDGS